MDAQLLNLAANHAADLGADDTNDDDIPSIINDNPILDASQDEQDQSRNNNNNNNNNNPQSPLREQREQREQNDSRRGKRRRDQHDSRGESSSSSISSRSSNSSDSYSSGQHSASKRKKPSKKPPKKDDKKDDDMQDASQERSEEDEAADRAQAIDDIFGHWQRTRSLPLIKVAGNDDADFYQALEGVPHDVVMRQQALINNTSYEKMFMDGVYFCIWYASKGLAMLSEYLIPLTKGWFPDLRMLPMAIEAREYEFKCALRRLYRTLFPKTKAGGKLHPGLELLSLFAMTCMTVPLLAVAGNKLAPMAGAINNFVSSLNTNGPAFVDHNLAPSNNASSTPSPTPPSNNPLFGPPSSSFSFSPSMHQQQAQQPQQQPQQGAGLVDMLGKMASGFGLDMNAITKALSGITQTAQTPTTTIPVKVPDDLDTMPDTQPAQAPPCNNQQVAPKIDKVTEIASNQASQVVSSNQASQVAPNVAPKPDERPMFGEMDSLNTINSS